jgi:hypothetical protein
MKHTAIWLTVSSYLNTQQIQGLSASVVQCGLNLTECATCHASVEVLDVIRWNPDAIRGQQYGEQV